MPQEQTKHEARNYHRTQMKRELIIQKLREQGCRITRQRRILLDIILEEECSCCKEIYYKALQKDSSIGPATVRLPRLGTGILPSRRGPIRRTSRSVDDRPNLDGT